MTKIVLNKQLCVVGGKHERKHHIVYGDQITDDGTVLIYEGHDVPRSNGVTDSKQVDQPEYRDSGILTENGKFHKAAQDYKKGLKGPDIIRVYEKIKPGIWSDNGYFHLVDSWVELDDKRWYFVKNREHPATLYTA